MVTQDDLSKEQIDIMRHTHNRSANGNYCGDSEAMKMLVAMGLMQSVGRASFCPDEYFSLTGAGRECVYSFHPEA